MQYLSPKTTTTTILIKFQNISRQSNNIKANGSNNI